MISFYYDIDSDHKTMFKHDVTRIVRQNIDDQAYKCEIVREVTDAYVRDIGERPEVRELDELASWIIFGTKGVSMRKKMEIKAMETAEANGREAEVYGVVG